MMLELYIFFQFVTIILFISAFFTKQEILWALCCMFASVLMFTSYNIEKFVYQANTTLGVYVPTVVSYNYGYLSTINFAFLMLAVVLMIFDIFDKYGSSAPKKFDLIKK